MDPGLIERVVATDELEEARGLLVAHRADVGHLQNLLTAPKRPVLLAIFHKFTSRHLVEPGNMAQERHAGGVDVDADVIDARLDDSFERFLEAAGMNVVLVEADADGLGIDLDQFAERVLQTTADGDGAAQGGVEVGKLLAADGAGRIDAGPGLVDDDVNQIGRLFGDEFRDEFLGLAASGAVADGNDVQLVPTDHLFQLCLGFRARARRGGSGRARRDGIRRRRRDGLVGCRLSCREWRDPEGGRGVAGRRRWEGDRGRKVLCGGRFPGWDSGRLCGSGRRRGQGSGWYGRAFCWRHRCLRRGRRHGGFFFFGPGTIGLLGGAFLAFVRLGKGIDHAVAEQIADFIEGSDLATGAEGRIDGQHPPAAQRRLQQQTAPRPPRSIPAGFRVRGWARAAVPARPRARS